MENLHAPDDAEPGDLLSLRLWATSDVKVDCGYGYDNVQVVADFEPEAMALGLPPVAVSLYLLSTIDPHGDGGNFDWDDLDPVDPADLDEDGPELMAAGVRMLSDELTACALHELDGLCTLDEADEQLRSVTTVAARRMLHAAAALRGNAEVLR